MAPFIVLPCRACMDNSVKCGQNPGDDECETCSEDGMNCDRGIWQEWLEWLGPERESILLHGSVFNKFIQNDARYSRNVKWDNLTDLLRDISRPERLFGDGKYKFLKNPWLDIWDYNSQKHSMAFRAVQYIVLITVSLNNFASGNKMPCKCSLLFLLLQYLLNKLDKFRWYTQRLGNATRAELYVAQHAWTDNQCGEWGKRTPLEQADLCSLLCPWLWSE